MSANASRSRAEGTVARIPAHVRDALRSLRPESPLARAITRLDTPLFVGDSAGIFAWRCDVADPMFEDSGPTSNAILAFPRTAVRIRHVGGDGFLADPMGVAFYNAGQEYRRQPISRRGHRSDWYWLRPDLLREIVRRHDPTVDDRPEKPFPFAWSPVDSGCYFAQRRVFRAAREGCEDALELEEAVVGVADLAIGAAYAWRGRRDSRRARRSERRRVELAEAARDILARRPGAGAPTLSALARELSVSVFHLCRVFREQTGTTLANYRNRFRLRRALERIPDRSADLTQIALDLGFSSHSHFTHAFRREFGITPSVYRDRAIPR